MWWMLWRALVHYAVDDVASTGTLCGGCRGEKKSERSCQELNSARLGAHHGAAQVEFETKN
jgi:hypothetical protein